MYKTINYCDNLFEYWGPALCIYIVPGILFVWAMARMASRNPKYQTVSDEPKAGFFKQCLWILIAMFGGVFVVDKTTHEQFKRHRIVQKAIGVWLVLISIIAIVFGDNKLAFRNAYEMAVKNNTMEIYSGDVQFRAFPSYELHLLLSRIKKLLSFLGVAVYMWCYKPSPTSIWFKARKVIGLFMLYFAYTALVIVYTPFDLMVFGIILLLATLLLIDYRKKDKRNAFVAVTEEAVSSMPIPLEKAEIPINETNNSNMVQSPLVEKVEEMAKEEIQPIIEQESLNAMSAEEKIQAMPSPKPQSKRQVLMKKILRYIIFVTIIGGVIGAVWGIKHLVEDYNLSKTVNEIIYNFENGDKETKREFAKKILSINYDWGYENASNSRIQSKIKYHKDDYHKKAFDYIESMAYKGDAKSQYILGQFYFYGEDNFFDYHYKRKTKTRNEPRKYYTKYDLEKAAYWFNEAALLNHPAACNNIGVFYQYGIGIEKNIKKAIEWLRKGAELGDSYAQVNYGNLLATGVYDDNYWPRIVFLEKDVEMARYWWKLAAAQGDERAKDSLQKLYE